MIDLKSGLAVHARAGNRDSYQPLPLFDADPVRVAERYLQLGLAGLYVADLDAIVRHAEPDRQLEPIIETVGSDQSILIDVGWRGDESPSAEQKLRSLVALTPSVQIIAASESARGVNALRKLADLIGVSRIQLGLDYRQSRWVSHHVTESEWCEVAEAIGINKTTLLDVSAVGQGTGPLEGVLSACRKVRRRYPEWQVTSGGGIRDTRDVETLVEAGCDRCLVATMLHPLLKHS